MREQDQNTQQGDFGEAWLEAVAAGCGLLHGRPTTVDLQKADVQITYPGTELGTYYPTVNVQVKTTIRLRQLASGDFSYDLEHPGQTRVTQNAKDSRNPAINPCPAD
ncbi:hypothetical protein ACN3XK_50480 [Actinomadura welshii]